MKEDTSAKEYEALKSRQIRQKNEILRLESEIEQCEKEIEQYKGLLFNCEEQIIALNSKNP